MSSTIPPRYLPSADEISAACAEIQRTWSDSEFRSRAGYLPDREETMVEGVVSRVTYAALWRVPVVRLGVTR